MQSGSGYRRARHRRTVYDLKRGLDTYGREIFIQRKDEITGKPTVWYRFDRQGKLQRHERKSLYINVENLGETVELK